MISQTSLITFISTEHGRMRRHQRDINKRDLKRAIKYGNRKKSWGNRWVIQYDGIVFVTDRLCSREVTAYPAPLECAALDQHARLEHIKAHQIIKRKPELCGSHTVLVVDNSGSMRTQDILLHRDRQTAAYSVTALELVAEQLFNGTANNSDVVSLVEFSEIANVVFQREPVSWELYNKLLSRRDTGGFKARNIANVYDWMLGDSNYLPALDAAEHLLSIDNHESCALCLFFVSDGAPTDAKTAGLTPQAALEKMKASIRRVSRKFGDQLSVSMVGFGNGANDFTTLKVLADAANEGCGQEKRAVFMYCNKLANGISSAMNTLVTSTMKTRSMLTDREKQRGRTKRTVAPEIDTTGFDGFNYFKIQAHFIFDPRAAALVRYSGLPPGALRNTDSREAARCQRHPPPLLALNSLHCGEGAERLAFRCQLSERPSQQAFAFSSMVAKETNLVELVDDHIQFHKGFCETQSLAAFLAVEFNQRLRALPQYNARTTPAVEFIQCSVLVLEDPQCVGGLRGVLVEKMLDLTTYSWKKWNDNAGAIDGRRANIPIDIEHEMAKLDGSIPIIEEGDSDEEDSHEDLLDEECTDEKGQQEVAMKPEDFLQAFTHFTYRYTNTKALVCDLQGIYNTGMSPPTFELTDPAIHYASKSGREMVFGRTDRGKQGIKLFFKTHKCTEVCKMLQLSRKNKDWNVRWRAEYSKEISATHGRHVASSEQP